MFGPGFDSRGLCMFFHPYLALTHRYLPTASLTHRDAPFDIPTYVQWLSEAVYLCSVSEAVYPAVERILQCGDDMSVLEAVLEAKADPDGPNEEVGGSTGVQRLMIEGVGVTLGSNSGSLSSLTV